nr:MAG TPA: hypothetical protein [Caudoviricetes sp.]
MVRELTPQVLVYRAQNEAYMCRSAKNAVIGLCFSVLSAT